MMWVIRMGVQIGMRGLYYDTIDEELICFLMAEWHLNEVAGSTIF